MNELTETTMAAEADAAQGHCLGGSNACWRRSINGKKDASWKTLASLFVFPRAGSKGRLELSA